MLLQDLKKAKSLLFPKQPVSCQEADTFKPFTELRYADGGTSQVPPELQLLSCVPPESSP